MEIASYEIDVARAGVLLTPAILLAATTVWLLLATGIVGRITLYFEELPHRAAATQAFEAREVGIDADTPAAAAPGAGRATPEPPGD